MLRTLQSNIGTLWCKLAHDDVTWPVHGKYECAECGRRYPAFANDLAVAPPHATRVAAPAGPSFGRV